ncbi:MAG: DUF1992 domain-containing protein [Acidobacteriota bacterium]|nr:DUF1992 domain-containing protein [Acidobacteriota bacterium]
MSRSPITERAIATVAENRIRDAQTEGLFNNLPGAGRPLPCLDEPYDPNWWLRQWVRRERLTRALVGRED